MCSTGRSLGDAHVIHLEGLREGSWLRIAAAISPNRGMEHQVHGHVGNAFRTRHGVEPPEPSPVLGVHGPNQRILSPLEAINRKLSGRIEREGTELESAMLVVVNCCVHLPATFLPELRNVDFTPTR